MIKQIDDVVAKLSIYPLRSLKSKKRSLEPID